MQIIIYPQKEEWMKILERPLFDTSALTASASISAATHSVYGNAKSDPASWLPSTNIYSSAPASNTSLAAGDYDSCGTTAFCDTSLAYGDVNTSGYNDFAYNSSGIANISKTGITKTSIRNANYDVANSEPTWSASKWSEINFKGASTTGTTNDPKLVITYSTVVANTSNFFNFL